MIIQLEGGGNIEVVKNVSDPHLLTIKIHCYESIQMAILNRAESAAFMAAFNEMMKQK